MLRFDKAIYLSLLLKSTTSVRLSKNVGGSDFLLFLEFHNIFDSILKLYSIHFIVICYFSNINFSIE